LFLAIFGIHRIDKNIVVEDDTNLSEGEHCYKFGITTKCVERCASHKNIVNTFTPFYMIKCNKKFVLETALKHFLQDKGLLRRCKFDKHSYTELFTTSKKFQIDDIIKFIETWVCDNDEEINDDDDDNCNKCGNTLKCNSCGYSTLDRRNWAKHIKTVGHIQNTTAKDNVCRFCGQKFNDSNSLHKHFLIECTVLTMLNESLGKNKALDDEVKALDDEVKALDDEVKALRIENTRITEEHNKFVVKHYEHVKENSEHVKKHSEHLEKHYEYVKKQSNEILELAKTIANIATTSTTVIQRMFNTTAAAIEIDKPINDKKLRNKKLKKSNI
jgi:hypothetical protein